MESQHILDDPYGFPHTVAVGVDYACGLFIHLCRPPLLRSSLLLLLPIDPALGHDGQSVQAIDGRADFEIFLEAKAGQVFPVLAVPYKLGNGVLVFEVE